MSPVASAPKTRIRDRKHAAEIARDLYSIRESIRHAQALEQSYSTGLKKWLKANREEYIEQEGHDTLRLISRVQSYVWDMVSMPDEDLQELRKLGLLTVRKGEYDAAIKERGEALGLLDRYAHAQYGEMLRFEQPPPKRPKEKAVGVPD